MSRGEYQRNETIMKAEKKRRDECADAARLSLQCREKHPDDKSQCQKFFDTYKKCKGDQLERIKQKRFEDSGGVGHYSDPPWKHWKNPFK